MSKINLVLWVVSLTLQCTLLTALVMRGMVRRLPIFTILIAFYVLRSFTLYVFSAHLRGPSYALIFSGLALTDLILQTSVAWEVFSAVTRSTETAYPTPIETPLLRRLAIFCVFLIAAAALAAFLSAQIHANPRAPMDRGVLFTSALFLLVFARSLLKKAPSLIRRIAEGFALYAGVSILCQIGRTLAAVQHNAYAFNGWSYGEAAAYLAVVFFWIIVLLRVAAPLPVVANPGAQTLRSCS